MRNVTSPLLLKHLLTLSLHLHATVGGQLVALIDPKGLKLMCINERTMYYYITQSTSRKPCKYEEKLSGGPSIVVKVRTNVLTF